MFSLIAFMLRFFLGFLKGSTLFLTEQLKVEVWDRELNRLYLYMKLMKDIAIHQKKVHCHILIA